MGTVYSHLSLDERIEIYRLLACGYSRRLIAAQIGRSAATVSRELRRNSNVTKQFAGGYLPVRAHQLAERRRRWDARFKMQRQPALRRLVRRRLAMGWSPEQIAGRLARDNAPTRISHESIYRYIYHRVMQKDWWHRLLPQRKNRRGRLKRGGIGSTEFIKKRRSIAARPLKAADRKQAGHWEADLMAFAKYRQNLLVLHERTSRVLRLTRIANKTAPHVVRKIGILLTQLPSCLKRTMTFDNGTEFAHHFKLNRDAGLATYFCDPHAPWQKGGIENAIGRMRRRLPRKADLATISAREVRRIVQNYNNTPRKCLGYRTPNEVFNRVALQP